MVIRADPQGLGVAPGQRRGLLHGHQAAERAQARVLGRRRLADRRPDDRVDAVGRDHDVGTDGAAVGKEQPERIVGRDRDADAFAAELDAGRRDGQPQDLHEVRAVGRVGVLAVQLPAPAREVFR